VTTHLINSVPPLRHPKRTPPQLSPQRTSSPPARATYQPPNRPKSRSESSGKSPLKSKLKRSSERLMHLPVGHGHNTNDSSDRHCGWPRSQTYFGDQTAFLGMRESTVISGFVTQSRDTCGWYYTIKTAASAFEWNVSDLTRWPRTMAIKCIIQGIYVYMDRRMQGVPTRAKK
jgi:hypothetical protein